MIKIICVGNIKEKYLKDAIKEYEKRLTKYTKLEIIEVKSLETNDINKNLKEEANNILKHLKEKDYIISLDRIGRTFDSIELSKHLEKILTQKDIVFIIGGSNGLDTSIKNTSNDLMSFSNLTFPHQLFRMLLLEQIYRSFKILNNEQYHK